jgi:hypothetical protein
MLRQSSTAELGSITAALRGDLDAHTAALRAYCDQRVAALTEYSAVSVRRLLADRLGHRPVLDGSVDYRTELQAVFSSGPSHFVLEGSGAPDAPFIYGASYGLNADPSTRSAAIVLPAGTTLVGTDTAVLRGVSTGACRNGKLLGLLDNAAVVGLRIQGNKHAFQGCDNYGKHRGAAIHVAGHNVFIARCTIRESPGTGIFAGSPADRRHALV